MTRRSWLRWWKSRGLWGGSEMRDGMPSSRLEIRLKKNVCRRTARARLRQNPVPFFLIST